MKKCGYDKENRCHVWSTIPLKMRHEMEVICRIDAQRQ